MYGYKEVMNMNQKGFTLIEIVGVVIVFAVILLVSLPAISKTLKHQKDQEYNQVLNDVYAATEQYVESNRTSFIPLEHIGGEVSISIALLQDTGYLKENLVNPKTGKKFSRADSIIVKVNKDGTLTYTFKE